MVLDELADRAGIRLAPGKGARSRAVSGEGRLAGRRVVLARPLTYMNESVRGLLDYHSIAPSDHDELDIGFASVRLSSAVARAATTAAVDHARARDEGLPAGAGGDRPARIRPTSSSRISAPPSARNWHCCW